MLVLLFKLCNSFMVQRGGVEEAKCSRDCLPDCFRRPFCHTI